MKVESTLCSLDKRGGRCPKYYRQEGKSKLYHVSLRRYGRKCFWQAASPMQSSSRALTRWSRGCNGHCEPHHTSRR